MSDRAVEWTPLDAHERLHTRVGGIAEMVTRHDERITAHDSRLRDGAKAFDDIREAIAKLKDELRGPKQHAPWWVIASLVLSAALGGASLIMNALK